MQTDTQRKDQYAAKNVAATVALKVASRLSGMRSRFGTAMQSLVPIEIKIQGILNGTTPAIPTIQYPFYLNFGRELWALQNKGLSGNALTLQAQTLSTYYQARHYTQAVLIQIALDCFGLVVT